MQIVTQVIPSPKGEESPTRCRRPRAHRDPSPEGLGVTSNRTFSTHPLVRVWGDVCVRPVPSCGLSDAWSHARVGDSSPPPSRPACGTGWRGFGMTWGELSAELSTTTPDTVRPPPEESFRIPRIERRRRSMEGVRNLHSRKTAPSRDGSKYSARPWVMPMGGIGAGRRLMGCQGFDGPTAHSACIAPFRPDLR